MSEIHFLVKQEIFDDLTWEEMEVFEKAQEGNVRLKDIRPILARFVVNGDGQTSLPHKEAMQILGKVPMSKLKETIELFMQVVKDTAIPNQSGSPSKSLSDQDKADSPSLDGS